MHNYEGKLIKRFKGIIEEYSENILEYNFIAIIVQICMSVCFHWLWFYAI